MIMLLMENRTEYFPEANVIFWLFLIPVLMLFHLPTADRQEGMKSYAFFGFIFDLSFAFLKSSLF